MENKRECFSGDRRENPPDLTRRTGKYALKWQKEKILTYMGAQRRGWRGEGGRGTERTIKDWYPPPTPLPLQKNKKGTKQQQKKKEKKREHHSQQERFLEFTF